MGRNFIIILLALVTLSFTSDDNQKYPQTYFRSPVDFTVLLSGTFGELRPNHFHSGIDIKSKNGKVGNPLYAAADGYISRIKIQASGYGNALYIDHPNGYTTVYAHMHKFTPEVEQYVKGLQHQKESFGIDVHPEPGRFTFKKGEVIGKMGNSGRSFGPHVHFEIRNTVTEEPINPLLFGIKVKDNIAPKLHQIRVYPLNKNHEPIKPFNKNIKKAKSGRNYIGGDTLSINAWRMGVGIKAYDHMNGTHNWNGVYNIETYVDGQLIHQTEFEKFHFDNTRYLNAHIDYRQKLLKKAWFNRCYRMPGNELNMYPVLENDGVFSLSTQPKKVKIVVRDVNGNSSEIVFWVKRKQEVVAPKDTPYSYVLPYNEDNLIDKGDMFIHLPKGALYENVYLHLNATKDQSTGVYSSSYKIHNDKTPLQKWCEIGIIPENIPLEKREKAVIALCEGDSKPVSQGGTWKGDMLTAKSRDFGKYCVMIDDVPPTITPIIFKPNLTGFNKIQFKLKDNFKTSKKLDTYTWKGYIDGKWILFKPNANKTVITHRFEKNLPQGQHTLLLEVTDERGNRAVFERTFTR